MIPEDAIAYCLEKNGAYEDYPFGFDVTVIKVEGKIFAQFFKLNGKDMATFNCERIDGEFYRRQYPGIVVRGWHCPTVQQPFFNTVPMDNKLSDDVIKEMIDSSYIRVIKKLPKYIQKSLTN